MKGVIKTERSMCLLGAPLKSSAVCYWCVALPPTHGLNTEPNIHKQCGA